VTAKRSKQKTGRPSATSPRAASVVLEEVIDASLHPDRAHHDEIGRTEEPSEHTLPSPREQPAEAIDIGNVEE
jgi:hypothetical protein